MAFPTETVYGLGADATNPAAVELIYQTKGRPDTNPLIIHVADIATARRFAAEWPDEAQKLADRFWPGPLTLVLPKRVPPAGWTIPDSATAGLATVGLRVPNHPLALAILRAFEGPLAAPSANRSTRVSPTTAAHVREEFPAGSAEPAMILDGGACEVGIESTVVDLTDPESPAVLRPGRVTAAQIEETIGRPVRMGVGNTPTDRPAASPGQQEIHYAPSAPAYRFSTAQRGLIQPETPAGRINGLVALSPLVLPGGVKKWGPIVAMSRDPEAYARRLYEVLREIDAMEPEAIFIEMPPDEPQWQAVRDRLRRATRELPT